MTLVKITVLNGLYIIAPVLANIRNPLVPVIYFNRTGIEVGSIPQAVIVLWGGCVELKGPLIISHSLGILSG